MPKLWFWILECTDLWTYFVHKKRPIDVVLTEEYEDIYTNNDLSVLLKNTVVGEMYTMVLQVSSTCPEDVEIGFSGDGGWFKTYVPANSSNHLITITDIWKGAEDTRLESRQTCGLNNLTIHQVQLVKGTENCLNQGW